MRPSTVLCTDDSHSRWSVVDTLPKVASNKPEIGDMDESVVKRSEDAGNAKDIFTYSKMSILPHIEGRKSWHTFANLRPERDILGRWPLYLLFGRHSECVNRLKIFLFERLS